jgi:hypothetical protein
MSPETYCFNPISHATPPVAANAKQLHGHRYARFRGLTKVRWQCLLAAAAQNIKKIAMAMRREPKPAWG